MAVSLPPQLLDENIHDHETSIKTGTTVITTSSPVLNNVTTSSSTEADKVPSSATTIEISKTILPTDAVNSVIPEIKAESTPNGRPLRRIRRRGGVGRVRRKDVNEIPDRIKNDPELKQAISTSLPPDYEFEVLKTIWRIDRVNEENSRIGRVSKKKDIEEDLSKIHVTASTDKTKPSTKRSPVKSKVIQHVALQMPEGLLCYSCIISDIVCKFSSADSVSVLGDVTYGACCVADIDAKALGADLLVHYGHSCLVPLTTTVLPVLYVFVEIRIDVQHAVDSLCHTCEVGTRVHVMGTVQFRSAVTTAAKLLNERDRPATIPQVKPLSPGEVLGCTAPSGLGCNDNESSAPQVKGQTQQHWQPEHVMFFLSDGRFHLEAAMIANPSLRAFRYDPYAKMLTEETYDMEAMLKLRRKAVRTARSRVLLSEGCNKEPVIVAGESQCCRGDEHTKDNEASCCRSKEEISIRDNIKSNENASVTKAISTTLRNQQEGKGVVGIILGTLGRQGNPAVLDKIRNLLRRHNLRSFVLLLSEIFPSKLDMFGGIDFWVQVACPRLSVDWGHHFSRPVLSPYEFFVCFKEAKSESGKFMDTNVDVTYENSSASGLNDDKEEQKNNDKNYYPMDFYGEGSGRWTNYHPENRQRKI